jgi:IclR family acetate operon transcriptional repressor
VQSLDRLMTILETVGAHPDRVSAAEVAQETGLSLSTVSRLMIQFADAGLLYRTGTDRRYCLGPRVYALARAADAQLDLPTIARPVLEGLRDLTGETVSMHVLRGSQRVCIAEVPSRHPLRRVVPVGLAEPLAGSATGAVLLADRSDEEQQRELMALSDEGRQRFAQALRQARETGWVLVVDDWVGGLAGLSVAVRSGGKTEAAVSVSGPSARFTRHAAESHLDEVLEAARTIAARAGRVAA